MKILPGTLTITAYGVYVLIILSSPNSALSAETNAAAFPAIGQCEKNWSDLDTLDTQLERIERYENCVTATRDRMIQSAHISLLESGSASESLAEPQAAASTKALVAAKAAIQVAADAQTAISSAETAKKKTKDDKQFLGWNWGIGVGASFGLDGLRVSDAEIVEGTVRVKNDITDSPRIVLELHNFIRTFETGKREAGHGPFAAVNFGATDGNTLTAFGLGWMAGVKRADGKGSFNIGLGLMLDQGVKTLGDGFSENAAPPSMETAVRFREESQLSALVFVSTSF